MIEFSFNLWENDFQEANAMKVQIGYIYHIKDGFFDKINDKGLMINHENGQANLFYYKG